LKLDEVTHQNKELESKIETLMESEEERETLRSEKQEEEMIKLSLYHNSITNVKQVLNEEFSIRYEDLSEKCVKYTQAKNESIISQLRLEKEGLSKDLARYKEMYNEAQEEIVSKYNESDELVQAVQNLRAKVRILEMENQRYKLNKVDSKILKLQLENETLRGEYEKMKTDLLLSKENWAQELNNLYEEIQQKEQRARTSRLETSRIAEERDIFKTFIEKKLTKKKKPSSTKHSSSKSWFDFLKS
jgi:hypothetical protein